MKEKLLKKIRRHQRIRARMEGTAERPRLVVFRSLRYNYAQLIDDISGKVLLGMTDKKTGAKGTKTLLAKELGKLLAKQALEKGIKRCVFDRAGYKYHGRVKAIAEGARENGLQF